MEKNSPEPRMLEEVRRWRREVYEARKGLSLEERQRRDRELLAQLGLSHLRQATPPASEGESDARRLAG